MDSFVRATSIRPGSCFGEKMEDDIIRMTEFSDDIISSESQNEQNDNQPAEEIVSETRLTDM